MQHAGDFDAIIIGAGIAGASLAYFLSRSAKVLVLEREAHAGMHSTGRSAAMFMESYGCSQVRALTRASRSFLEHPPDPKPVAPILSPRGALFVATRRQRHLADALQARLEGERRPALRMGHAQAQALLPALRPRACDTALLDTSAADLDVHQLHQLFLRGSKGQGAQYLFDASIRHIERSSQGWSIDLAGADSHAEYRAPVLVDAAGAWVDQVAVLAGVAPIGIVPKRRSAFTFSPPAEFDVRRWPAVIAVDESFYFKPDAAMLLGSPANADPTEPHDVMPQELDIATGIHRIEQATTLRIRRPHRTWAGLRSFVASGQLVGDFDACAPGFFWLAGQGGYGIQTSPAMGQTCAARILGRPVPAEISDAGLSFEDLAHPVKAQPDKVGA
jgi:D-arginine dehydrogenase